MPKTLPSEQYHSLLASEERFRTLIEKSTDAIQLLDENGQIIYSSDSVQTVLGYTPDELVGANPAQYIHPDDFPYFAKQVGKLMKKPGSQIHLEYRVKHKNGEWVWLETIGVNHLHNPAIRALVGNFRNITKRKEYEQTIAESEARLRFMAESMPQKIFTATPGGQIDYFNPQWLEYTGLTFEELQNANWLHLIHPDDTEKNLESWRRSMGSGEPFEHEHRYRSADGSYRWHLTRARPMKSEKGEIVMWIGSSTDIHDVKQAKQRQQRLERRTAVLTERSRQLLELNKAKDEFISLASHQLRTPATGVKQYLGMILEGYAGEEVSPKILKMIEVAYESNERQLKIVNDLLKVAYIDAGKLKLNKESCNVVDMLKDIVCELDGLIQQRQQTVVVNCDLDDPIVKVDSRLMRMVLENIVDNASKYSPNNSKISITIDGVKNRVRIAVADQGVGISLDNQTKLFKKFSRIDNKFSSQVEGTGLGLYWAKQVVDMHKGSIQVLSEEGKGTTFVITFPRS